MVPLTQTRRKVYVDTTKYVLSKYYKYLNETLNRLNTIKPKSYTGENVADLCAAVLVDNKIIDCAG